MNIENILSLIVQLQSLGFEKAGYSFLKRISFKPEKFILSQRVEKGKDHLSFQLFFERDAKQGIYVLLYYEASLQKETPLINSIINGINPTRLEKSMLDIDWRSAFDFDTKKQLNLKDKASWEKEQIVESVIEALSELEKFEEGKVISVGLKLKYWSGTSYQKLFGNISPIKSKYEVSQRFYFSEGQTGISVDEAYRFLQNRWLEKDMQTKKKESGERLKDDLHTSSGNGLLQKKRLGISKRRNKKDSNPKK